MRLDDTLRLFELGVLVGMVGFEPTYPERVPDF